jgi:hypothetical protein
MGSAELGMGFGKGNRSSGLGSDDPGAAIPGAEPGVLLAKEEP